MTRALAGRIALVLVVAAAFAAFFLLDLGETLSFDTLKARREELAGLVAERPLAVAGLFFLVYVAATALSVPGAALLTLAAGAVFEFWLGLLVASFASTLGATLAFLSSRYLLRDWVQRRFGPRLKAIDRGIERDGITYLLALRLNPAFPFFLVNLGMGLTRMSALKFALVSQIGMLPGTAIYVNAGTELARIRSPGDILSPGLIASLVLLSLFPLIGKWAAGRLRRRRVYRGWKKPRRFDRNLVVIGAGSGGLVSAYIAAAVRAKVTLIEANKMGGDCLNTGCVPSKTLIRSARAAHEMRSAATFGLAARAPEVDFPAVMARIRAIIAEIAPADSVERYSGLGVDVRIGFARIVDPWTVEVNGERLTTRSIVVAAGGEPVVPAIPGIGESGYLTSDTMWDRLAARETLPEQLVILGGGPIGVEMAQAFARLGSQVTIVQSGPRILAKEDEEVSAEVARILASEGVRILTGHEAVQVEGKTLVVRSKTRSSEADGSVGRDAGHDHPNLNRHGEEWSDEAIQSASEPAPDCFAPLAMTGGFESSGGEESALTFDELIVATGRRPRLEGYGLEELGIDTGAGPEVNPWLETRFPNIYLVGDVAGSWQFTHAASHQAWHAAVNALFGGFKRFKVDYRVLPRVTFTDPEVAVVGHNERSAREAGVEHEVVRHGLGHLDRAVAEGAREGWVKLLVQPGRDRILGATIVGHNAGETVAELALAMKHGIGLKKLLGTVHAYPTMAEANKYAAGAWRKAHQPERLLGWVELYHRWRRRR